jgi:hypothetical protein
MQTKWCDKQTSNVDDGGRFKLPATVLKGGRCKGRLKRKSKLLQWPHTYGVRGEARLNITIKEGCSFQEAE